MSAAGHTNLWNWDRLSATKLNGKKTAKVVVGIAMALVLVAIMSTALVQEAAHEWLGLALFALLVVHVVLGRKWFSALFRGRWSIVRVLQVAMLAGLALCVVGQVASSLVLSKHAFGFLPALPGAGWARRVHMLCSYWAFIFAFAHVGLHARFPKPKAPGALWAIRIAMIAIACFGAVSFAQLGLPLYLTGQVQFAAVDFGTPLPLTLTRYTSIAVLVTMLFHYLRGAALAIGRQGN